MSDRLCEAPGCGTPLHPSARSDARFCSSACRVSAYRAKQAAVVREHETSCRKGTAGGPARNTERHAAAATDSATRCAITLVGLAWLAEQELPKNAQSRLKRELGAVDSFARQHGAGTMEFNKARRLLGLED